MWAQLITTRLKPGHEDDLARLAEELNKIEEHDPRRQEGLQKVRALMAEIFDGAPEFVDLTVVEEFVP